MKLNRLETHDRLLHFKKDQAINIAQGAEDCLKKNRLSLGLQQYSDYVYLFAHPRTLDMEERMKLFMTGRYKDFSEVPNQKMVWQPRLCKPGAETNSYLFRAISNTDQMEICWLIPPQEQWMSYKKGNVTEHETVLWSIDQYQTNRKHLEKPDENDLSDERIRQIYVRVASEIDEETRMKKIYPKEVEFKRI